MTRAKGGRPEDFPDIPVRVPDAPRLPGDELLNGDWLRPRCWTDLIQVLTHCAPCLRFS
jgi:hypothetical protein